MIEFFIALLIAWSIFGFVFDLPAGHSFLHEEGKNPFSRLYLAFFFGPIAFLIAIFQEIYKLINK
jgi:hypothetical protein